MAIEHSHADGARKLIGYQRLLCAERTVDAGAHGHGCPVRSSIAHNRRPGAGELLDDPFVADPRDEPASGVHDALVVADASDQSPRRVHDPVVSSTRNQASSQINNAVTTEPSNQPAHETLS